MEEESKRIDDLLELFNRVKALQDVDITIENVDPEQLQVLRQSDNFPEEMLQVLQQIGCVRDFGIGCALIDWWVPCPITTANAEERCPYEPNPKLIANQEDLLFFAWDCDACLYFYDTTCLPWAIVVLDGLSLSIQEQDCATENWNSYHPSPAETNLIELLTNWLETASSIASP